jgi:hypothetical protein
MAVYIAELIEQLGGHCQEEVFNAVNRWKPRVQEAIRDVTRLKLSEDRNSSKRLAVPIQIKAGFPSSIDELAHTTISEGQRIVELIGTYESYIKSLEITSLPFQGLAVELRRSDGFSVEANSLQQMLHSIGLATTELRQHLKNANLGNILKMVEGDIMGAYHFREQRDLFGSRISGTRIDLYWLIIGAASRLIGVDVERLTVLVMAHELGHAYSHVGSDASGRIWADGFAHAELGVVEGIAQYYTWAVSKHLDEHHYSNFKEAYESKISCQSGPYVVHKPWTEKYSLEVFRHALMQARTQDRRVTQELFEGLLQESKERLEASQNT